MKNFLRLFSILAAVFLCEVSFGSPYCISLVNHRYDKALAVGFEEGSSFVLVNGIQVPFTNKGTIAPMADIAEGCFPESYLNSSINNFKLDINCRGAPGRLSVGLYLRGKKVFHLFDVDMKDFYSAHDVSKSLDFSRMALDPELTQSIRNNINEIELSRNRVQSIDLAVEEFENIKKILESKDFNAITPEDLNGLNTEELVNLIANLRKENSQLSKELEEKITQMRQQIIDLKKDAAQELQNLSEEEDSFENSIRNLDLPDLEMPEVDPERPPFEEANSPYARNAEETIQILQRALESANRQYFIEVALSWTKEQLALDAMMSARLDVQPPEYKSFVQSRHRVKT